MDHAIKQVSQKIDSWIELKESIQKEIKIWYRTTELSGLAYYMAKLYSIIMGQYNLAHGLNIITNEHLVK